MATTSPAPAGSAPAASPRASPPPPPAPIAIAPGARAERLAQLYAQSVQHVLGVCSYETFASCFPTPAARRPAALRSVWAQVLGKVEAKAAAEFDAILQERDVVRGLNGLEGLVSAAKGRKAAVGENVEAPVA